MADLRLTARRLVALAGELSTAVDGLEASLRGSERHRTMIGVSLPEAVLEVLRQDGGSMTAHEVFDELRNQHREPRHQRPEQSVRVALARLRQRGKVERTGVGTYRAVG